MKDKLVDGLMPVEIRGLTRGSDGGLERCAPALPLRFGFEWHGTRFLGIVSREADRLVLSLGAALARVPFSGEDKARRANLLSLIAATDQKGSGPTLTLSGQNGLELKQQIALAADTALTATVLVTEITAALLSSAAVLDLIAESGLIAPATTVLSPTAP